MYTYTQASQVAQWVKNLTVIQEMWFLPLGGEDPLEKGMETHSSILAWRIPWTESLAGYRPKETPFEVTKSQTQLKQLSMHTCLYM